MIVSTALIIFVAIFNPNEEKHKSVIIEKYKQENPISGFLNIGDLFTNILKYKNYIFYSTMTIGEKRISTGFLGNVNSFIFLHAGVGVASNRRDAKFCVNTAKTDHIFRFFFLSSCPSRPCGKRVLSNLRVFYPQISYTYIIIQNMVISNKNK